MSIHVIVVPENNSNNNVMADVKPCCQKKNVPFDQNNKDHVYRVGNKYIDESTGKHIKSIVVKFKVAFRVQI